MKARHLLHIALICLADWQVIPVGLICSILIFPDRFIRVLVSLAVLAIPVLWLLHRLSGKGFFTRTPADIALLFLLFTMPVGWWAAALPELAIPQLVKFLASTAFFYALVNTLAGRQHGQAERGDQLMIWAGRAVLGTTMLLSVISLLGIARTGSKYLPAGISQAIPRLITAFWNPAGFHPNIVGGFLAMSIPVTAAYLWATRMGTHRLLLSVVLLFELGVLFLTQSRGALFGLGVALVVVAVAQDRRWAWVGGMALVAGLAATAIIGLQPALDLVVGGFGGSTLQSAAGRLELFSRALYMLEDFSFTGVGLGMFPKVLSLLYPLFLVGPDTEIPHAHNILLQAGVDHGIPGLVAFLALLIVLGYLGIEAIQESRGRPWQPLAIGLLAGLVAYMAHGQVDAYGYTPRAHILVWGHFGLLTAVWKWTRLRATARDE